MARVREPAARRRAEGHALVILAALCWAGGGLLAKWLFSAAGPESAGWPFPPMGIEMDPLTLSAARALVSFAVAFVYLLTRRRHLLRVRSRDLPFLAVFGVLGLAMVHFAYFKTISLTGVATAILLEYLAPVIVLVFSVTVLGQRLTPALPAAVFLSVSGCALMVGAFGAEGIVVSRDGLLWGLASAVFFATYSLMGKYAAGRFAPWTLLTYGLGAAAVFWMVVLGGPGEIIAVLSDVRSAIAVVLMSVVSTVIPFGAFLQALTLIEATQASVTSTMEPVIAGVVAWFTFGEHLTPLQLLGGLLVIAAVMLSQARTRVPAEMPVVGVDPVDRLADGS